MTANDDLLRPSLEKTDAAHKSIYSTTTGYLTAFIGGPFAAIAMAAINSGRLGRSGAGRAAACRSQSR